MRKIFLSVVAVVAVLMVVSDANAQRRGRGGYGGGGGRTVVRVRGGGYSNTAVAVSRSAAAYSPAVVTSAFASPYANRAAFVSACPARVRAFSAVNYAPVQSFASASIYSNSFVQPVITQQRIQRVMPLLKADIPSAKASATVEWQGR